MEEPWKVTEKKLEKVFPQGWDRKQKKKGKRKAVRWRLSKGKKRKENQTSGGFMKRLPRDENKQRDELRSPGQGRKKRKRGGRGSLNWKAYLARERGTMGKYHLTSSKRIGAIKMVGWPTGVSREVTPGDYKSFRSYP